MPNQPYQDPAQWYSGLATFYAAASMLVTDGAGKVLLVKPNYRDYWSLPGGMVEAAEDPARCAARETQEEVGLTLTAGPPLVIAWEPASGPRPRARISFYFAGGVVPDGQAVQPNLAELDAAAFFSVADALPLMPPSIATHLAAAWRAWRAWPRGELTYLAES